MSYPPTSSSASKPLLPRQQQPSPGQPQGSSFQDVNLRSPPEYDVEHAMGRTDIATPGASRSSTWTSVGGVKGEGSLYDEIERFPPEIPPGSIEPAQGGNSGAVPGAAKPSGKFYELLVGATGFTKWLLIVLPVTSLLWIPGILSVSTFPNAKIWGVRLLFWSIWWTVTWAGWWGVLSLTRVMPLVLKWTLGAVAASTKKYIDWAEALHRYITLFAWTLIVWVSWHPLIDSRQQKGTSQKSIDAVDLIGRLLFAFYLCSAILLFEKFSIQWIAGKFHERSYAERIADQKFAIKSISLLYQFTSDAPDPFKQEGSVRVQPFFKQLSRGVKKAASRTTMALGNVASEITGGTVLQPNSPASIIRTILESPEKTAQLARRLFRSFVQPGSDYLLVNDIARFYKTLDEAERVFALFDKDSNGDASQEEIEMACLEFHREQLSIEHSMRDLDSAVGRLDNILMTVYVVVAVLIIATALEAGVFTLVTGAGTLILGLSWLIGGSLQEVLTSIIFLFIKHPFDVGDRVDLTGASYTVKEIRLLTTVFLDSSNVSVQAPNTVLNTMFIQNIRRSPQMSETVTFDVSYDTTFEDLERLREKMLRFVKAQRRDYQPYFDVMVKDFPEQEKMTLAAEIKYKSNAQHGAIKARRRNRWMCALKAALAEAGVYGPKGNPNGPPPVTRFVNVPWDQLQGEEHAADPGFLAFPSPANAR